MHRIIGAEGQVVADMWYHVNNINKKQCESENSTKEKWTLQDYE